MRWFRDSLGNGGTSVMLRFQKFKPLIMHQVVGVSSIINHQLSHPVSCAQEGTDETQYQQHLVTQKTLLRNRKRHTEFSLFFWICLMQQYKCMIERAKERERWCCMLLRVSFTVCGNYMALVGLRKPWKHLLSICGFIMILLLHLHTE